MDVLNLFKSGLWNFLSNIHSLQSGKRGTFITAKNLLVFAKIGCVFLPIIREKGIFSVQACVSAQTGSPMPGHDIQYFLDYTLHLEYIPTLIISLVYASFEVNNSPRLYSRKCCTHMLHISLFLDTSHSLLWLMNHFVMTTYFVYI